MKAYNAAEIEPMWSERWVREQAYVADAQSDKQSYTIVIPPPNVTGSLHVGHALNNTLQDILCRYMRMRGREVLWLPGTDHAGIATQNVVERQLVSEGKSRRELGREAFIERVWKWKEQSGGQIISQLKRLGCSCDWSRERFTMDEGLSAVVKHVFVELFKEGLIYRGDYMINWCPRCGSALADLEVEYPDEAEEGKLYRLAYPLVDAERQGPQEILVDTTRPETMLGDTAVAVHPEDERYRKLVGKSVKLPLVERIIPIIADDFVDPEFGTGAVKITPGHDPNDFEAGRRHQLPIISVIGLDGKMNAAAGPKYQGMDRFECRKQIIDELKQEGVLKGVAKHQIRTGVCYRCQTITEPLVSTQWFMKMSDLAKQARAAVESGKNRLLPEQWKTTYYQWLENIRDWCISRQLWWGHQIPVWYCACGELTASTTTPENCGRCGGKDLKQDPDVLDTWFSSALWPFSTLGWPEQTPDFKKFYPTSALITGFDILFFWVARMMMMGLKFTKQPPFADIYLHAMVRDEHGQKMSKTKGNVIDPLDIISSYGADSLRFTLAILTVQGRDLNLATTRIEGYRNFVNKLWNAIRYVFLCAEGVSATKSYTTTAAQQQWARTDLWSRWILSKLAKAVVANNNGYERYQFSEICQTNYRFVWDDFCAWYLEITKIQLKKGDAQTSQYIVGNLLFVSDVVLRLLHPTIPFVTEELWAGMPEIDGARRDLLCRHQFPALSDFNGILKEDDEAERQFALFEKVVAAVRTIRAEKNIPPATKLSLWVSGDQQEVEFVLANEELIKGFAKLNTISRGIREDDSAQAVVSGLRLFVPLQGAVDLGAERARVAKEIQIVAAEIVRSESKLNSTEFMAKAPPPVVAKEQSKLDEYRERLRLLEMTSKELDA